MSALAIAGPRLEQGRRLLVAGWTERYSIAECGAAKAAQWQRFMRCLCGGIPGRVGRFTYGISTVCGEAGYVDYLCGVEVADFSSMPRNFGRLCVPARRYLVFEHDEHVSSLHCAWRRVAQHWSSERRPTDRGSTEIGAADRERIGLDVSLPGVTSFERYGESFDVATGMGGVELWIPLAADTSFAARTSLPAQSVAPGLGRVTGALTGRRR